MRAACSPHASTAVPTHAPKRLYEWLARLRHQQLALTVSWLGLQVKELLDIKFNSTFTPEILAMYPLSDFKSPYFQTSRILGDDGFTCAVRRTARWLLKAGAPVSYVYVARLCAPRCGCVSCHVFLVP